MNLGTPLLVLLGAALLAQGQTSPTDEEILRLGHERWMTKMKSASLSDKNAWFDAERRFGIALSRRNERLIAQSPRSKEFEEFQTLLLNITKGACRLSDDSLQAVDGGRVLLARAEVASASTLFNVVADRPNKAKHKPEEIWDRFRATELAHQARRAQIERFATTDGGYTYEQYLAEYRSLGKLIRRTMAHPVLRSESQKRSVYGLCLALIDLTRGGDPLP